MTYEIPCIVVRGACVVTVVAALSLDNALCAAADVPPADASARTLDVEATVNSFLARIRAVDAPRPDPSDPEELYDYWVEVSAGAASEFRAMMQICPQQEREALQIYWDGFRKGTAHDRMRWYLPAEDYFFPTLNGFPLDGTTSPSGLRKQRWAAEIVVRSCLEDPKGLGEYYRPVAWRRWILRNVGGTNWMCILADRIDEHIHDSSDPDYWVYARSFMVMAYATSRVDLLADRKPEELGPAFAAWHEWFEENGGYLVASPDQPVWQLDLDAQRQRRVNGDWKEKQKLPELNWPSSPFADWEGVPAIADGRMMLW
jgi:hypothetical protein